MDDDSNIIGLNWKEVKYMYYNRKMLKVHILIMFYPYLDLGQIN